MGGLYYDGSTGGGMWLYGLDWAGPEWRNLADACECGNVIFALRQKGEFLV